MGKQWIKSWLAKFNFLVGYFLLLIPFLLWAQEGKFTFTRNLDRLGRDQLLKAEKELQKAIELNPKDKMAYFYLGEVYYRQGKWVEAGKAFHRAAKRDHKFKEAWNGYGKALLKQEWLSDNNLRARWQFEKALKIDSDYLEARVNLARAYAGARMKTAAIDELEKVINKGGASGEVYYLMGTIYDARVPYGQWEEIEKAVTAYRKAVEFKPEKADTWYRLGIDYYRLGRLLKAKDCLQRALEIQKNFKNAYLALGLVYYDEEDWSQALENFKNAFALMDEEEWALFTNPSLILSKEEKKDYEFRAGNKSDYLYRFWKQRDPDPTTEPNERLIEHYQRVAYARLFFSEEEYPWDERGESYIRYGRPDLRFSYGIFRPTETWVYNHPQLTFVFSALGLYPRYRIPISEIGNAVMFAYEAEKRENPEVYDYPYECEPLRYIFQIANFKKGREENQLALCFGIPVTELYFEDYKDGAFASVEVRATIFDSLWQEVRKIETKRRYPLTTYSQSFSKMICDVETVDLKPGRYNLALSIRDLLTGNREIYTQVIEVENFREIVDGKAKLKLSSILWSDGIDSTNTYRTLTKNYMNLKPYPIRIYSTGQPLYIYFEIYNLEKDLAGNTHYQLDYTLMPHQEKKGVLAQIGSLFKSIATLATGGKKPVPTVSYSYKYSGDKSDDVQFITVDVGAYPPGLYDLDIGVTDLNSGQVATKHSVFQVSEEFPLLIAKKTLFELGFDYLGEGKVAVAKKNLGEDFDLDTSDGTIYFAMGTAYHLKGQYRQAEVKYLAALRNVRKEEKPDILSNLGALYFRRGDLKKAEEAFRQALAINEGHKTALFNLSLLYFSKGLFDYAIVQLQHLRERDPEDEKVLFNLGRAFFEVERFGKGERRFDKAIKYLKQALRINPHYSQAHQWLGISYWERGESDKAKKELQEALKLNPGSALTHLYLGLIFRKEGDYQRAEEEITQALALDADLIQAYYDVSDLFDDYGNFKMVGEKNDIR